jgi:hypothetical protein
MTRSVPSQRTPGITVDPGSRFLLAHALHPSALYAAMYGRLG